MTTLRELTKNERGLIDSFATIDQFVATYNVQNDQSKIETRLAYLETIYKRFLDNRAKLEAKQEQELSTVEQTESKERQLQKELDATNRNIRLEYEGKYFAIKDFLVSRRPIPTAVASTSLPPCQPTMSRVHLPVFKIPSFDGNVKAWLSFRDAFQSMIVKDVSLTPVDKFNYLLSVLTNEARTLVESIEVTADNYDVAWQMLTDRFENKKILARTLMDGFLDVDSIKKESYDALVGLIDSFERNLLQLNKIGLVAGDWSPLLAHLLYRRLDVDTQRHWERFHKSREPPKYDELLKFLREHLATLQPLASLKPRGQEHRQESSKQPQKSKFGSTLTTTAVQKNSCPFCQQPFHSPFKCDSFQKLNPLQRHECVKKAGLCLNCLSPSHLIRVCPSSACRVCGQKHHTMLHMRPTNPTSRQGQEPTQSQSNTPPAPQPTSFTQKVETNPRSQLQTFVTAPVPQTSSQQSHIFKSQSGPGNAFAAGSVVLLSTVVVNIADCNGNVLPARALLDCGSERNLISERLASKLNLRRRNDPLSLHGVGASVANSKHSAIARMSSHCTNFAIDLKFHILSDFKHILPSTRVSTAHWTIPSFIRLADPHFNEPDRIDAIIGAEAYYSLLLDGLVDLGHNLPILKETVFGWIVSGRCNTVRERETATTMVCSNADLEKQISRFWELESCYSDSTLSVEERQCEAHFTTTTLRDPAGRFIVSLPKKEPILDTLGDSKGIALRRFFSLERRLQAKPALMESYAAFIGEYIQLGHMVLVDPNLDSLVPPSKPYYMPHHCIERPDSATTKLRVVFDASCATHTGVSLNDALMVGPVVQDELYSIILRFRLQRYAVVADLEKMYRQVLVNSSDRHLQRIFWRNSPSDPILTYELETVTYGTASAPFLATRCLLQLSLEGSTHYPNAAAVLSKDFYIDDLLTGVSTEQDGINLCGQLIGLLQSAGFKLHKWATNSPAILNHIPAELRENRNVFELDSSSAAVKTLGLLWQPVDDVFRFKVPIWENATAITKRIVLADAARLFDPLGLVGPIIVRSKIFMQQLWKSKIECDRPVEMPQQQFWKDFRKDLEVLDTFSIPRWAAPSSGPRSIELHGFCDASESAYGACIYVRTVTTNGAVSVHLLTAKSRVAPQGNRKGLRQISLPRLELSSALLLSHLYEKVKDNVPTDTPFFGWTDSMITIHWLAASPARWKKFIGNRCAEIQQITDTGVWGHVPGTDNPADVISRGMPAVQLIDYSPWWQGPIWLSQPRRFWPNLTRTSDDLFAIEQLEMKPVVSLPVVLKSSFFDIKSSLITLVRLVAYLRRFSFNARERNRSSRRTGYLSTLELEESLRNIVMVAQHESFPEELQLIHTTGQVKSNSRLKSLAPILVDGVLRTRGRLQHAAVPFDRKQPMILDNKHPLTLLVARHYHQTHLHAGPQLMIAAIRSKFWPLRIRDLARKVVHDCVTCFRCKPTLSDQIMADLPPARVTPTLPFLNTGVDFCGPFYLKPVTRKSAAQKCYVAVFICMSTKAIHLELVGSMSAPSFIASLKRFVARRGVPRTIFCDNGTNFVGARRTLNEFLQLIRSQQERDKITRHCADEGIQFQFIPPRSPHFGGIWEAAVKSLKTHLRRTLSNAQVDAEEFQTLLAQVEACMNSRPLTQLSNDPADLDVLTPGHFLVHRPLTAIPEPSYEEVPTNRLEKWQAIQEYLRRIWKRWSSEYLSGLQQRTRWTQERNNIHIGTMVLVREENLPPQKWRFGRVVEVFPGKDGYIRVVRIRTKDGFFKRAITQICVLPIADNQA